MSFLCAVAATAVGLGCGTAGDRVVSVDGKSISKAAVDHWTKIQQAMSGGDTSATAREHVIEILITYRLLIGESRSRHVPVSSREIADGLDEFENGFRSRAAFEGFLREQGKSVDDQRLVIEIELLLGRLEHTLIAQHGVQLGERIFHTLLPREWRGRTSCDPGYIVPNCRQYKGHLQPQITT
jgi:hypothetical protein